MSINDLSKALGSYGVSLFKTELFSSIVYVWSAAKLKNDSLWRYVSFSLILIGTTLSTILATTFSSYPVLRVTIGAVCGAGLFLKATDELFITRRKGGMDPARIKSFQDWLRFGFNLRFNERFINTKYQGYVPAFNSQYPNRVPSKTRFLVTKALRIVGMYLFMDLITFQELEHDRLKENQLLFAREKDWQFPLALPLPQFIERLAITIMYWLMCYIIVAFIYDILSFCAVAVGLTRVDDWPPLFGPMSGMYSLRNFWNTCWHQTLRHSLKINARFITHEILCLHKNNLISKYTELCLVFCISGLIHALTDIHANIPLDDSGSILFFILNAVAIMIEDFFVYIYSAKYGKSHQAWHRVLGYMWVGMFMTWVVPIVAFPQMRGDGTFPMPFRFVPKSFCTNKQKTDWQANFNSEIGVRDG